ncbi:tetratricopeptide repeat protein [Kordia sp.]|uniref:tetratricopeptide repeat protein n=1 Tax=Kordia sp. TaxID=1965332 RepID=UPI003D6B2F21
MKYILPIFVLLASFFSFSQNQKLNQKDTTLVKLQKAVKLAETTPSKVKALLAIGNYHLNNNYKKAEPFFTTALNDIQSDPEHKYTNELANIYGQLGVINKREGDYSVAVAYYLKSKDAYETIKDTSNIANIYHNIAMVYRDLNADKKAIRYFKKAIDLKSKLKEIKGQAIAYNMMGVSYRHFKKNDSALWCYEKAKQLFRSINDTSNIYHVNSNLATLYQGKQNFDMALPIYLENLKYYKTQKNRISLFSTHHNLSRCYTYLSQNDKALYHNLESIKIAKKEGFDEKLSKAYLRRSFIQKRAENYKDAFENYRLYKKQFDKVFNSETTKKIQELELKHLFKQEKLADSLQFIKEKNELKIITKNERSKKQLYFLLMCIVLIAGFIISSLIRRNYKNKSKHLANKLRLNQLELTKYTKALLTKSLEQDTLNKEIQVLNEKLGEKNTLHNLQELANTKILTKEDWVVFKEKFSSVHPLFFTKIKEYKLTESEERLLALEKLNLNNADISSILGIAGKSVVVTRYRLRKKLNIPKEVSIADYLELS